MKLISLELVMVKITALIDKGHLRGRKSMSFWEKASLGVLIILLCLSVSNLIYQSGMFFS